MAKSKKTPGTKKSNRHISRLSYIIGALLVLVIGLQVVLITNLQQRVDKLEADELKALILEANNNLRGPLAIEPTTGRQYIPEARLVLPPKENVQLGYYGDKEELAFSTQLTVLQMGADIRNAQDHTQVFEKVPYLQACSRQIMMRFDNKTSSFEGDKIKLYATKPLADGRTAHIYLNEKCRQNAGPLLQYLKQIESY